MKQFEQTDRWKINQRIELSNTTRERMRDTILLKNPGGLGSVCIDERDLPELIDLLRSILQDIEKRRPARTEDDEQL